MSKRCIKNYITPGIALREYLDILCTARKVVELGKCIADKRSKPMRTREFLLGQMPLQCNF